MPNLQHSAARHTYLKQVLNQIMRRSDFVGFLLFISYASATLIKRQSCYSYVDRKCNYGGEQWCCFTGGQVGTFATCDDDGDPYYIASCTPNVCTQEDYGDISC